MIDLNEPIRTLGLNQPYASLMLHGKIETRWVEDGRKPPFIEGLYIIYACQKSCSMNSFKMISGKYCQRVWEILSKDDYVPDGTPIGIGRLVKKYIYVPDRDGEKTFVDSFDGRMQIIKNAHDRERQIQDYQLWCLEFEDMKPIEWFPFKGKQGIGFLTDEQKALIKFK